MSRLACLRLASVLLIAALLECAVHAQTSARPPRPAASAGALASNALESDGGRLVLDAGTVVSTRKISSEVGGLPQDALDQLDHFGSSAASLGDLDGDGLPDVAVGAPDDDDGGLDRGAAYVLFLRDSGAAREFRKISSRSGGFTGALDARDHFGSAVARIGDLDGDGVPELAVGASGDDDNGIDRGAVYVLFLRSDGSVRAHAKISSAQGGFAGPLRQGDAFGSALAPLGDLDGDGRPDLAVGAPGDDDGGISRGALWCLFLDADGSVKAHQKISASAGGFTGVLRNADAFGGALATLGVRASDSALELAVGASGDDDGASDCGATWVLALGANGLVQAQRKISATQGGFTGHLDGGDLFGSSLAAMGDLDGNGALDLAVGALGDDDHDPAAFDDVGAVWILLRATDGSVLSLQKISDTQGGFGATLRSRERFGSALAALADMDGNGVPELCVGTSMDCEGSTFRFEWGAAYVLFLRPDDTVRTHRKISFTQGGLPSTLDPNDSFGSSVVALGDLDGDGVSDLAVGAPGETDPDLTGSLEGALWILFLRADGTVKAHRKLANPNAPLSARDDQFGTSLAVLGDLDGDGLGELVVGAQGDSAGGGPLIGAVWILSLDASGAVREQRRITATQGGGISSGARFGASAAALGDLDRDGTVDLAVGAPSDGLGTLSQRGAVSILFLNADGSVRDERKLPSASSGFPADLIATDFFGSALATLGDLDGDGTIELAVGAKNDRGGGPSVTWGPGAVWVLSLASDGRVERYRKLANPDGDAARSGFGSALAAAGDLDGDGVGDLCVGAFVDDDGGTDSGAVHVLLLARDGSVKAQRKISASQGGFSGASNAGALFGSALAALDDRDGDGARDLAVGAPWDDDGAQRTGALWLLGLDGIATLDFEGGDDQARTPLAHGQSLATPGEFGRTVKLASSGPNLGAAIFDTTPRRPDPAFTDSDLLVGLGNACVLQDPALPAQSVPDVFDVASDAETGGALSIRFRASVELARLDLIDVDKAHVRLIDAAGRARLYRIPKGWTGERVTDGPPGFRTLDLTTLAPQRGFGAIALADEDPGFDARAVIELELTLYGSGAFDNLRWDPHPGS